jgi:O-antigen/teichoic acid export membrane protein
MGVIQRQGLKSLIIGFVGIAIGILSTMFIYPHALEVVGMFQAMLNTAVLIGIVVLLGTTSSSIRFFPTYSDSTSPYKGFLTWLLLIASAGFLGFLLLFPWIRNWMIEFIFHDRNDMYEDVIYYLIPLTFFVALLNLLSRYISNYKRIAVPAIFEQLTIKFALPAAIVLHLQGWLSITGMWFFVILSYLVSSIGLLFYLGKLGGLNLGTPSFLREKKFIKEYSRYSGFTILNNIGAQVAFRLDTLMVAHFIQFEATAVFVISAALAEIVIKPMRSMIAIAGPVIVQQLEQGNLAEVRNIYRKSSLNMTIIGLGMFLLIWSVLPSIFQIMPNTSVMNQGIYVFFFLGLAQVWDMATGINSEIISYSKHYRVTLYLTLFLAIVNVSLNFWLIPLYGITGAALATCISLFLFNVIKLVFIQVKYQMHPFTARMIPPIAFAIAACMIARWLPTTGRPFFDLVYKSAVFCLLYGLPVWRFGISPDINLWIEKAIRMVKRPRVSTDHK